MVVGVADEGTVDSVRIEARVVFWAEDGLYLGNLALLCLGLDFL